VVQPVLNFLRPALGIAYKSAGQAVRNAAGFGKATRDSSQVQARSAHSHRTPGRRIAAAILTLVVAVWAWPVSSIHAANAGVQGAKKDDSGLEIEAPTAMLIEAKSGSILYEKNPDQPSPPGSMLKLMTAEFVFNALHTGELKETDQFTVSENAWRHGGAPAGGPTMFAAIHSHVPVADLLRGLIIVNGNDSAMTLAEGIAGNEREFAAKLTKRAHDIGLTQSSFANASGMSDPDNKMTVRDIATLARHIVLTYPDDYKLYNERDFLWNKIRQTNRNPLLNALTTSDGMNAGSTKEGGYGMVGSAVQDGLRLIVVVNGLTDPDDRVAEAKKLLEWGFRNFELRNLFAPDQVLGYAKVFGGDATSVGLISRDPVGLMVQKNGGDKLIARIIYQGPVRAPVQPGQQVGVIKVWRGNNIAVESPLYTTDAVGIGSMTRRAFDGVTELVIGLFRFGVEKL
jgi:serine-type D-Ala-D-Ala carboxypeptidase (penicillin-binding protein 5/6)